MGQVGFRYGRLIGSRAAEGGGAGVAAASHGAGRQTYFAPPPRNREGVPKKNCVEKARNSITPNIPLVETGQARKIGGPSAPKGAPLMPSVASA